MEPTDDRIIAALESLIKAHSDRHDSYQRAQDDTEDADLKVLFARYAAHSEQVKQELSRELVQLGGTPPEGTTLSGILQQSWMEFKAGLSGNDRETVLDSCEQTEESIQKTYRDVLEPGQALEIRPELSRLLARQAEELRQAQAHLRALRNAASLNS